MRKGYVSVSVTSLSSSREFGSICFFDNVAILVWRKMEQATKKKTEQHHIKQQTTTALANGNDHHSSC